MHKGLPSLGIAFPFLCEGSRHGGEAEGMREQVGTEVGNKQMIDRG